MNILQNRIDSFKTSSVKWPYTDKHQYPKIESYARAGFSFVRRPKAADSIRCFLCDKDFSNWKASQSPFARHSKESPNCPWIALSFPDANNKALTVNHRDPNSDPRGSVMKAARLATFNNHNFWPPNKGILGRSKRYPNAIKLAEAGFFFSPTLEQSARIKCPYCKITIAEPDKEKSILDKHHELSADCVFFEPARHMRAAKNKRDTVGSAKSSESFKTANSELDVEESMDTEQDYSLYEPTFVQKKSKSKVPDQISESEDEQSTTKISNKKGSAKKSIKAANPKKSEPIKIIKRRRINEPAVSNTGKRKREDSDNEKNDDGEEDDSIWNIEQTFTPTSTVRKPVITFGNKKSRVLPSTRRSGPTSVDIFANLKPSMIEKPNAEKQKGGKKSLESNKKSLMELPKVIESTPKKPVARRKLLDTSKKVVENEVRKQSVATESTSQPMVICASSSSSSSEYSKATSPLMQTSTSHKTIISEPSDPLKALSPSIPPSLFPKMASTDNPISTENIEPMATKPFKDKGKGRAVEYNLPPPPSVPAVKKTISLSKSKKNVPITPDTTTSANNESIIFENLPSSAITKNIIPFSISDATYSKFSSSASSSFEEPNIPSKASEQKSPASPVAPVDDMCIDKPDSGLLNDLPETNTLMETTPPIDLMDRNPSPKPGVETLDRNKTPPLQLVPERDRTPPPPLAKKDLSPIIRSKTPPPFATPRTMTKSFSFMQSTPNQNALQINAFDIFGDCPISPIGNATKTSVPTNSIYQDTPVMQQSGRTRNVIMKEPDGAGKLIQNSSSALPPPLDINNIQPASITDEQKKMKVEEYLQNLFEKKIEQVREHGLNEIKKIEAASEVIRSNLTASMNQ